MNFKIAVSILFSGLLFSNPLLASECLGDQQSKNRYTFEVVPQFPPTQIFTTWGPLLSKLGNNIGVCFDLIVPKDIPAFESDLRLGRADFIYANPYHFLVALKKQQYSPLLAEGKNLLSGLVVEKASNPASSLKSLDGKKVSFPAPNAFGASLLIRAELAKKGISVEPVFVKTHSNVYRSVIAGDTFAGGGVSATLKSEPKEIQSQLKVIYKTEEFTPHPIAAKPTVPLSIRNAFVDSFLNCAKEDSCKSDLAAVRIQNPK